MVLDLGNEQTAAYSQDGFNTYLVDQDGHIHAALKGIKTKRPDVKTVLTAVKELQAATAAP